MSDNPTSRSVAAKLFRDEDLPPEAAQALGEKVTAFAEAHPGLDMSDVAGFAMDLLGLGQEEEAAIERNSVLEKLRDPRIGHAVDYYGSNGGGGHGHGIKERTGDMPPNTTLSYAHTDDWRRLMATTDHADELSDWHHGRGVVLKIVEDDSTTYFTHYQRPGFGSRPDVESYTVIPNIEELKPLMADLDSDASALVDIMPEIYPQVADNKFSDEITLVSPTPIDVTEAYTARTSR